MRTTVSKSKLERNTPLGRLQQVRMGAHDRLLAEAHLARAEYVVDAVVELIALARRGLRAVVLRPFRRVTAAFS